MWREEDSARIAQLVEQLTLNQWVQGSSPCAGTKFAGVAQLVEHHVANVIVVGSSPITRSIY